MIKDRKDADQKELTQAKLLFSVFKDDSKNADHPEHLGKSIYLPKKRYQKYSIKIYIIDKYWVGSFKDNLMKRFRSFSTGLMRYMMTTFTCIKV